jgi:hypothetical protein
VGRAVDSPSPCFARLSGRRQTQNVRRNDPPQARSLDPLECGLLLQGGQSPRIRVVDHLAHAHTIHARNTILVSGSLPVAGPRDQLQASIRATFLGYRSKGGPASSHRGSQRRRPASRGVARSFVPTLQSSCHLTEPLSQTRLDRGSPRGQGRKRQNQGAIRRDLGLTTLQLRH